MSYQMQRAEQLERKLSLYLGSAPRGSDWLAHYLTWLEKNGVPAEPDGSPAMLAFDDHQISLFVIHTRKERADAKRA